MALAIWAQARLVSAKRVKMPRPQKSARLCCSVIAMSFSPVLLYDYCGCIIEFHEYLLCCDCEESAGAGVNPLRRKMVRT
jgi:hypothetical protein